LDEEGGEIMHLLSLKRMTWFITAYVENGDKVLDVGSRQAGRNSKTYKQVLLNHRDAEYLGMDVQDGENVDLVVKDPYNWTEIEDETYDVVICGQVFEHVEFFWEVFKEMVRVLKPGGYICLIAPSLQKMHTDVDCWRFLPDGMRALAKWGNVKLLKTDCYRPSYRFVFYEGKPRINDTYGVFQK
jgi:SAM-dependent methyltransferase